MKKIVLMSLLLLCGWISAGAVDLNKENRDPKYVESIVNRSQKIVDKLGLTDVKAAEDALISCEGRELSVVSFIRPLIRFMRAPPLWPSHLP